MQSASAVPFTLLQVAASLSPILSICRVPPGQVAETIISSGVQISSHRDFTGNFAKRAQPGGGGGSGWAFGAGRSCRANTTRRSGRTGNAGGPGHAFFSLRAKRSGGPLWTGWARGTLRTRSSLRALKTPR